MHSGWILDVTRLPDFFPHWLSIQVKGRVMCINYPLTGGVLEIDMTTSAMFIGKTGMREADMMTAVKSMYGLSKEPLMQYVPWSDGTIFIDISLSITN
jgi:hypothetical protein